MLSVVPIIPMKIFKNTVVVTRVEATDKISISTDFGVSFSSFGVKLSPIVKAMLYCLSNVDKYSDDRSFYSLPIYNKIKLAFENATIIIKSISKKYLMSSTA